MPVKKRQKVSTIRIPTSSEMNEPPENFLDYCTLLYGRKGIGKTSATASFPGFLNCQFEPRRRNVKIRQMNFDCKSASELIILNDKGTQDPLEYDAWKMLVEVGRLAIDDDSVKGLAIDSVDLAYSACQESLCADRGVEHPSAKTEGSNGWDELRMTFTGFFNTLMTNGLSILFISHAKEREQEFMEGTEGLAIVGPSCTPGCGKILKQLCDYWFFYGFHDGKRCVTLRDPDMNLDVACGNGFYNEDGSEIRHIYIPNDHTKFYPTINSYYKGETPKPVRKKTVKRKLPRK